MVGVVAEGVAVEPEGRRAVDHDDMLAANLEALPEARRRDVDEVDRHVVAAVRQRDADVADDRRRRIAEWILEPVQHRLAKRVELDVVKLEAVDPLKVERAQVVLRVRRPDGHVLKVQRRAVHDALLRPFAADDVDALAVRRQRLGAQVEDDAVRLHALRPAADIPPLADHRERSVHVADHHRRARAAVAEVADGVEPIQPRKHEELTSGRRAVVNRPLYHKFVVRASADVIGCRLCRRTRVRGREPHLPNIVTRKAGAPRQKRKQRNANNSHLPPFKEWSAVITERKPPAHS